mmetsp:Transcript_11319/g.30492  ORF Transcript_11319/g.30492 Transcript_11319/m.30492 type:complete len:154 (+) Transcript_11319:451-912(+)
MSINLVPDFDSSDDCDGIFLRNEPRRRDFVNRWMFDVDTVNNTLTNSKLGSYSDDYADESPSSSTISASSNLGKRRSSNGNVRFHPQVVCVTYMPVEVSDIAELPGSREADSGLRRSASLWNAESHIARPQVKLASFARSMVTRRKRQSATSS